MKAVAWHGAGDMRVVEIPKPTIVDPQDIVLRVTSTTICGSDLHLYHHEVPGMEKGDVLGHEFMGIVDQAGSDVKEIKPGDRVVVAAVIADGTCWYCKRGFFSSCDTTNPSKEMEKMYGHRTAGIYGYSHLTGGYQGGHAEYVRVPYADVNCLPVPEGMKDEQVLYLSDIICTGWHGCELSEVGMGDTVAVWGCGPVGLCAIKAAFLRGAARVIAIDNVPYRLQFAKEKLGAETINFDECNVVSAMQEMVPGGPDACIDCAGFRFPKSLAHKIQRTVKMETDALDIVDEMVKIVRKCGRIALIGDYFGYGNMFPIGHFMEKGLTLRGGQVFVHKYWRDLLKRIQDGEIDPTIFITHRMALEEIPKAFAMFANKDDEMIKVLVRVAEESP